LNKVITGDAKANDGLINFYGAWGNKCNLSGGCTVEFDTMGRFHYGEFKNCYLNNARSLKK